MITDRQRALIAEWEPHREAMKPAECNRDEFCWVRDPFVALADTKPTTPRCIGCGGVISRTNRRRDMT